MPTTTDCQGSIPYVGCCCWHACVGPGGGGPFSQIKLTFTANHGSSAVCVGRLKLLNKGKQVPFPSGTKSEHKGLWSSGYHSDNLIKTSGYYCSESGSFKNSKGGEEVLVTMPSAVAFDSFSLQQWDGMGYSPKDFTVMGLGTGGNWVSLLKTTGFKFAKASATATFKTGAWRRTLARSNSGGKGFVGAGGPDRFLLASCMSLGGVVTQQLVSTSCFYVFRWRTKWVCAGEVRGG